MSFFFIPGIQLKVTQCWQHNNKLGFISFSKSAN